MVKILKKFFLKKIKKNKGVLKNIDGSEGLRL